MLNIYIYSCQLTAVFPQHWTAHWPVCLPNHLAYHSQILILVQLPHSGCHSGYWTKKERNLSCVCVCETYSQNHIQWSLRFKTPLFNKSLHFKTRYQWHHLYIFSINNSLYFKTTFNLIPYFAGWMGGLNLQGPLYMYCTMILGWF